MSALDTVDRLLINHLHGGFPVCERPYQAVARQLGLTEADVLARLDRLLHDGWLTRFGPLFQIEAAGGQFVLAAMSVPEARFTEVCEQVNQQVEVAHNYRRDHALNMWFVVAAESPAEAQSVCARIESLTGLQVWAFPKEREFFVELRLPA